MKKTPEFKYLNLDYFFGKFFDFLEWLYNRAVEIVFWLDSNNFKIVSSVISAIVSAGLLALIYKIFKLRKKKFGVFYGKIVEDENLENRIGKWEEIQKYLNSENPSDWKIALIEADSLIDEVFKKIGFAGENLGDRLKKIEPSDFDNLQNVWDAHKMRNKIAHQGDFALKREEALAALEKYEKALKELKYI